MKDGVVPTLTVCWAWVAGTLTLSMAASETTRVSGVFMVWPPGRARHSAGGIIARKLAGRHPYTRRRDAGRDGDLVRARRHRRPARCPADARASGEHAGRHISRARGARGRGAAEL